MDFIDLEAMDIDQQNKSLDFSGVEDNDGGKADGNDIGKAEGDFTDDAEQKNNLSSYRKFINQTKDPHVAVYEESDDEDFVDKNLSFMQLKIEMTLFLMNFQGIKSLSQNLKNHFLLLMIARQKILSLKL